MSEKRKKKTGSIAIPFLVTIFIATIIVGGAGYFIYHNYIGKKEDDIKDFYYRGLREWNNENG